MPGGSVDLEAIAFAAAHVRPMAESRSRHVGHVGDRRDVGEDCGPDREDARRHELEHRVLGAGDADLTFEGATASHLEASPADRRLLGRHERLGSPRHRSPSRIDPFNHGGTTADPNRRYRGGVPRRDPPGAAPVPRRRRQASNPPPVPTVTCRSTVSTAIADGPAAPRATLVLEVDEGDGTYTMAEGPFTYWGRTLTRTPRDDGNEDVVEVTSFAVAAPVWGWLFVPPLRGRIKRHHRRVASGEVLAEDGRPPVWMPPDRLDARAGRGAVHAVHPRAARRLPGHADHPDDRLRRRPVRRLDR